MGFPAVNYLSDNSRTEGELKVALEDLLKACKQIPGAGVAAQALTISAGSVTPALGASQILVIDTEAAAASDDLANIVTTNLGPNSLVRVKIANDARLVTVKHAAGGAGQLSLVTGGDFVLGDTSHWIDFYVNGTQLEEIARFPSAGSVVSSKSGNYTVAVADRGDLIECTATLTLSLPAAATAGKGFDLLVECAGGVTTIDPSGAETIGGASTLLLYRGDKVRITCTGTAWKIVQRTSAQVALDQYLQGFTYQPNGSDVANDVDVAAGVALDSTGVYVLRGAALTKRLDAVWAVGTNAGMLDTGAVGNNDYFLWVIGRSDTGVVDYLASLSSSAPTMPANYDFKRLIGWVKRSAGANVAWKTYELAGGGLEFHWTASILDVYLTGTLTTTRRLDALSVPNGLSVAAMINVLLNDGASALYALIQCPDEADAAPNSSAAPGTNARIYNVGQVGIAELDVRTNTSRQIAARASSSTFNTYQVVTRGFKWSRR